MLKTAITDRLLRVALIGLILMGVGAASVGPLQSIIGIEKIGFSDAGYALIVTGGALFSVVASVLVGIYTDQSGRFREALLAALAVGAAGGLLMFLVPSKVAFLLVHVVLFPVGATAFTQYFALSVVAARENPELDQPYAATLSRATFSGAFALTPVIWGYALVKGADVLAAYVVIACANLLALAAVLTLWRRDHTVSQTVKSGKGLLASLSELTAPGLLVRLVLICVITATNGLYNILLGLLILNNLGGAESDVALFAGLIAFIEIPVMMLTVRFLRVMSASALILVGVSIYGGFLAVLGLMPSIGFAWWLVLPAGIGAGIILSIPIGYVQNLVADRAGAGSSLLSVNHFGGAIIASAIFAAGSSITDYQGVAMIGAVIAIAASGVLFTLDYRRAREMRSAKTADQS
ncbi:MFS transporter [Tateyamaria omphalii]|uniref:MFS transporter n=1 Tax=Tateyamaria omphalii TaxID=299262 RepID=UPI001C993EA5|nr:MFS transporter [Tateyamaria omphalii]MBY5932507.1 MFS transporter [Tateyamaria omphalii]